MQVLCRRLALLKLPAWAGRFFLADPESTLDFHKLSPIFCDE
jgi:hypothetical protein